MTEPASMSRPEGQYTSDWTNGGSIPLGQQFRSGAMLPLLYGETGGSDEVLIDVDTAHGDTAMILLGGRTGVAYQIDAAVTAGIGHPPGTVELAVLRDGQSTPHGSAGVSAGSTGPVTARVGTEVRVPAGTTPTRVGFRITGDPHNSELNVQSLTVSVVGTEGG